MVYRTGLIALLIGSKKTATQAYTSPGIVVPCNAITPGEIEVSHKLVLWSLGGPPHGQEVWGIAN